MLTRVTNDTITRRLSSPRAKVYAEVKFRPDGDGYGYEAHLYRGEHRRKVGFGGGFFSMDEAQEDAQELELQLTVLGLDRAVTYSGLSWLPVATPASGVPA